MSTQANFNIDKFVQAQFSPRMERVAVPALADFFDDKDKKNHTFLVKGLTANEIAIANEAAAKNQNIDSIIKAISSASENEKIQEFRKAFGVSDDNRVDTIKRIEQLTLGCVEPKIETSVAVKIAEVAPVEFFDLTNKIVQLSGMGMKEVEEKQKPSGEMEE